VLEDKKRKQRLKEWDFNANIDVHMHACNDGGTMDDWPDVTSTNVSLTASVPIPTQTTTSAQPTADDNNSNENQISTKKQKIKLDIGGHSSLDKGLGSTQGLLSATYQPVDQTTITSDLAFGRKNIETSISTSTQLVNGIGLSAKVTRQFDPTSDKDGNIGFGFSSNRSLSLWNGRTVHAMFALGLTSSLTMQYGVLSATTWGFNSTTNRDESDKPLPRLSAKLTLGSQFPFECSIDQPHLSDSPYRSGRASVSWSPIQGYKLKAMLSRKIPLRQCKHHDSEFASNLVLGVEHTGFSGLKWIIRYQRPEGLSIKIPVVICSFLSPVYWNRVIFVSASSILLDEVIGLAVSNSSSEEIIDVESDTEKMHKKVSKKMLTCQNEKKWLASAQSKQAAERQLSFMIPVAKMKRHREESNNGLVIMKATYSSLRTSVDVTHQLQFYVNASTLRLPPSSKSLLMGFYELVDGSINQLVMKQSKSSESTIYDIIYQWIYKINTWLNRLRIGGVDTHTKEEANRTEEKHHVTLSVRYRYRKEVFEIVVFDTESLEIPNNRAINLGESDIVS